MTIDELAEEYEKEYQKLCNKIEGLRPLLSIYSGQDLMNLRKKIRIYYDMALECRATYKILSAYYGDDEE